MTTIVITASFLVNTTTMICIIVNQENTLSFVRETQKFPHEKALKKQESVVCIAFILNRMQGFDMTPRYGHFNDNCFLGRCGPYDVYYRYTNFFSLHGDGEYIGGFYDPTSMGVIILRFGNTFSDYFVHDLPATIVFPELLEAVKRAFQVFLPLTMNQAYDTTL